ncbi:MAG: Ig-like domain-containing protein [Candidatus Woesearchaeota archaeon]|nr:Ig-like domain-containing protein [Candidatus Woesearchaeota archaeon]
MKKGVTVVAILLIGLLASTFLIGGEGITGFIPAVWLDESFYTTTVGESVLVNISDALQDGENASIKVDVPLEINYLLDGENLILTPTHSGNFAVRLAKANSTVTLTLVVEEGLPDLSLLPDLTETAELELIDEPVNQTLNESVNETILNTTVNESPPIVLDFPNLSLIPDLTENVTEGPEVVLNISNTTIAPSPVPTNVTGSSDDEIFNYNFLLIPKSMQVRDNRITGDVGSLRFRERQNYTNIHACLIAESQIIGLDSELCPQMNTSAEITLLDVPGPTIHYSHNGKDFLLCSGLSDPACTDIRYDGQNVTFNVSHFTIFTVLKEPPALGASASSCTGTPDTPTCNGFGDEESCNAQCGCTYNAGYYMCNADVDCSACDNDETGCDFWEQMVMCEWDPGSPAPGSTANAIPTASKPVLNSSNIGNNNTNQNLTFYTTITDDDTGDIHTNISVWYMNGSPTVLYYLPFEGWNQSKENFSFEYAYENHANVTNTNWQNITDSKVGRSYSINSTDNGNSHIAMNNTHTSLANFTVELWVKPELFKATMFTSACGDINSGCQIVSISNNFVLGIGWGIPFCQTSGGSYNIFANGSSNIIDGGWTHLACVNRQDRLELYVNGTLVDSTPHRIGDTETIDTSGSAVMIGADRTGGANLYNGTVDEFRVWNRSLSADMISLIYTKTKDGDNLHTMHASETRPGENWSVNLTVNDWRMDSASNMSNNVQIQGDNNVTNTIEAFEIFVLNSSEVTLNGTDENLSIIVNSTKNDSGDHSTNITVWYLNGSPILLHYLPFEAYNERQSFKTREYVRGSEANVTNATFLNGSGRVGSAYAFNTSDRPDLPNNIYTSYIALNNTAPEFSNFTIDMWVSKPQPDSAGIGETTCDATRSDPDTDPVKYCTMLSIGSNIEMRVSEGFAQCSWFTQNTLNSSTSISGKDWTHVACVYNQLGMAIYVNGTEEGSMNRSCGGTVTICEGIGDEEGCDAQDGCTWNEAICEGAATQCDQMSLSACPNQQGCAQNIFESWTAETNKSPIIIGADTSKTKGFNGSLDQVRIWNRSLSVDQISQIWTEEKEGNSFYTLRANETQTLDIWTANVTPNDGVQDGPSVMLNSITINQTGGEGGGPPPHVDEKLPPNVSYLNVSMPDGGAQLNVLNITVNITSEHSTNINVSVVLFQITPPNGTASTYNVTVDNGTATHTYNLTFNVPNFWQDGQYNVSVFANDTADLINNSIYTEFNINSVPNVSFLTVGQPDGTAQGNFVNVTVNVTDNNLPSNLQVDQVLINITPPNGSAYTIKVDNGSFGGDAYNLSFLTTIQDEHGTWTAHAIANDTNNNRNTTITQTFSITDTTAPNVTTLSVSQPNGTGHSGLVNITVNISDNIAAAERVDKVFATITPPNGSASAYNLTMSNGSNGGMTFNTTFIIPPVDADGNYTITVYANDTSDNVNDTISLQFLVATVPNVTTPSVVQPNGTVFNGLVNITVNVSDQALETNNHVDVVLAQITPPNGTASSYNLTMTNGSNGGITYNVTFVVPSVEADGNYTITFLANDTGGNLNDSISFQYQLAIVPNVSFHSIVQPNGTAHKGLINLTVNVSDNNLPTNRHVDQVLANITPPNGSASAYTLGMSNGSNGGTTYNLTFILTGIEEDGNYTVTFLANDTGNFLNNSEQIQFRIDTVPNVTEANVTQPSGTTGGNMVNVTINVTDNQLPTNHHIGEVLANITPPNGAVNAYTRIMTNGSSGGITYNYTFDTESFATVGTWEVQFIANDTGANVNSSNKTSFQVTAAADSTPVNVSTLNVTQPAGPVQNNIINITVNVTSSSSSNDDVAEVIANITYPNGSSYETYIDNGTNGGVQYNYTFLTTTQDEHGAWTVNIIGNDTAGNANTTLSTTFNVTDTQVPNVTTLSVVQPNGTGHNILVNLTVNVSDNIASAERVDKVFAQITPPNGSASSYNLTMSNGSDGGDTFNVTFFVDDIQASGNYTVTVYTNDTSGNVNDTISAQFRVELVPNVTEPAITQPNGTAHNGFINITVNVTDNQLPTNRHVNEVLAQITPPNGSASSYNLSMANDSLGGNTYNLTFVIPDIDASGNYTVLFIADDTGDSVNNTISLQFQVATIPNVTEKLVTQPNGTAHGGFINITVNVTDNQLPTNRHVDQVLASITPPNGSASQYNLSMSNGSNGGITYNLTFVIPPTDADGNYTVTFVVNDTGGFYNNSITTSFRLDIAPNVTTPAVTQPDTVVRGSTINITVNISDQGLETNNHIDVVLAQITPPNGTASSYNLTMTNGSSGGITYNLTFDLPPEDEDGNYTVTFLANDTGGNLNNTISIQFKRSIVPNVSFHSIVQPNGSLTNGLINITVNVTDNALPTNNHIDVVLANITPPNGSASAYTLSMTNGSDGGITYNLTLILPDLSEDGNYTITFLANDTDNNLNNSEGLQFKKAVVPNASFANVVQPNGTAHNGIINITVNITDNNLPTNRHVDQVLANITPPNGSASAYTLRMSNGSEGGNTYNLSFSISDISEDGNYTVTFLANDTGGNLNNSITTSFRVDTVPNVTQLSVLQPDGTGQGTMVNITVNITDNQLETNRHVDTVLVNITPPNGSASAYTLSTTNGSSGGITYNLTFDVDTVAEPGTYDITILANDTGGNLNNTITSTFEVTVVDTTPPNVSFLAIVQPNGTAHNGLVNVTVNVTSEWSSNENITNVFAQVVPPNGSASSYNLTMTNGSNGGITYNVSFIIPLVDESGNYTITIYANDTGDVVNDTISSNFNVELTPNVTTPTIIQPNGTAHNGFINITVNVTDNQLPTNNFVDVVLAQITPPNGSASSYNLTMNNDSLRGNTYNVTFFVDDVAASGNYTVLFLANDTSGNLNNTISLQFQVATIPNVTEKLVTQPNGTAHGGFINITVNVTDNQLPTNRHVDQVLANITPPNGSESAYTLSMNNDSLGGNTYNLTFIIPATDADGNYTVTFLANDSGNFLNNTITTSFRVDIAPNVTTPAVTQPDTVVRGSTINITVNISDQGLETNNHIDVVLAQITPPNGTASSYNYTMTNGSNGGITYNLTFDLPPEDADGNYTITFLANDTGGNLNNTISLQFKRSIVPNVSFHSITQPNGSIAGGLVNITVNVTDNSLPTNQHIDVVLANITAPNGSASAYTLTTANDSNGGTTYNVTLIIPSIYEDGNYTVTFLANDTDNNLNNTEGLQFQIATVPNVSFHAVDQPSGTSHNGLINLTVNVTDNSLPTNRYVDVVLANITPPNGSDYAYTLTMTNGSNGGTTYNISFIFPGIKEDGNYTITFLANDTGGNLNNSEQIQFRLATVPNVSFINITQPTGSERGRVVNITVNVTDNSLPTNHHIAVVLANITPPNGSDSSYTLTMTNGSDGGDVYNVSFIIPSFYGEGTYNITILANDTADNRNNSVTANWTITKRPPSINYTSPTLASDTSTNSNFTEVNITLNEPSLANLTFNWNGTDFTMYNDSLSLIMNFGNRSSIGESETTIADVSHYGNNGTCSGTTCPIVNSSGRYGTALNFDGSNDYVAFDNELAADYPFTVSLWFRRKASKDQALIQIHDGSSLSTEAFRMYITSTDVLRAAVRDGGSTLGIAEATKTTQQDVWHHATGVFASQTDRRVFLDGENKGTNTASAGPPVGINMTFIGQLRNTVWNYNGLIDEVRIWNRTLSDKEVKMLYESDLQKINSTDWKLWVNRTNLPVATYNHSAEAQDTSGNTNSTIIRTMTVTLAAIDAIPPNVSFLSIVQPNTTSHNGLINITVNVTSESETNVNISQVLAQITPPNGTGYNLSMANDSLGGLTYNATFIIDDVAASGNYTVVIIANDTAKNINLTVQSSFRVDLVPNVTQLSVLQPDGTKQGNLVNVTVNVTDNQLETNRHVDVVLLNITPPNGSVNAYTVVMTNGSNGGITYNVSFITLNKETLGTYRVQVLANDTGGNLNTTTNTTYEIITADAAAPNISQDNTTVNPLSAAQGTEFTIYTNATDDIGVSAVLAEIQFPNNGSSFNLTLVNHTAVDYNITYTPGLVDMYGEYNVTIIANDTNENINNSIRTNFTVTDLTEPTVTNLNISNSTGDAGTAFNISVNITDNINDTSRVDKVFANVTFRNGSNQLFTMSLHSGVRYNVTFTPEASAPGGVYNVTILANDTSDNLNDTIKLNFTVAATPHVAETQPPNVSQTNTTALPASSQNGTTFTITTNVTDNNITNIVLANITYPNSSSFLITLINHTSVDYNQTYKHPPEDATGTYNITIIANDTTDNTNNSISTNFTITQAHTVDTQPPNVSQTNTTATDNSQVQGSTFTITTNVTDNNITNIVLANITYPNESSFVITLVNHTAVDYNNTYTHPYYDGHGTYNVTIIANDTTDNTNNSISTNFTVTKRVPAINYTTPTLGNATQVNINYAEVNISIDEPQLQQVNFNWNNTNFSMYNDSLVLMMNFDNVSSIGDNITNSIDLSRYGNNGTLEGNAQYNCTSPRYGCSTKFDGDNDAIDVGNDKSLDLGTSFTLSAWVYVFSHDPDYSFLITKDAGSAASGSYDLGFKNSKPYIAISDGGWAEYVADAPLPLNTWQHIVGVRDSGNNLHIYVDSVLNKTFAGVKTPQTITTPVVIGVRDDNAYDYDGLIDEVRIWNRSLSEDEVTFMYESNLRKVNGSHWEVWVNRTGLPDTAYNFSAGVTDTSGNINTTEERLINISVGALHIADAQPPNVSQDNTTVTPVSGDNGTTFRIDTNVTDNNQTALIVDRVLANITYPNTSSFLLELFNGTGTDYNNTYEHPIEDATGVYNVTIIANDTTNNVNRSISTNFTINLAHVGDTQPPNVTNVNATPENGTQGQIFTIYANVTDNNVTNIVIANITFPNRSSFTITLANRTIVDYNNTYEHAYYDAAGLYNITIIANDTTDNTNNSISANFTVLKRPPSAIYTSPTRDNNTQISRNFTEINISLEEPKLANVTFTWNSTPYVLYNESLQLLLNFDNRSQIGENQTRMVDISNKGNNGSCATTTCPTLNGSAGKYGGAYEFDGDNDFIDVGTDASLFSDVFTAAVWIYPHAYENGHDRIIQQGTAGDGDGGGWGIEWDAAADSGQDRAYGVIWNGGSSTRAAPAGTMALDTWHHVTLAYDGGSNSATLYVNGEQDGTATSAMTRPSTINFAVGKRPGGANNFNGRIEQVQLWNKTFNAEEVRALYESNLQRMNETHWELWINRTELSNSTYNYSVEVQDASGNANDSGRRLITLAGTIADTQAPNVTSVNVTPENGSQGTTFRIQANVTDNNGTDIVLANITYPNASSFTIPLVNETGVEYNNTVTFTINDVEGLYNITIIANDTLDNVNNTVTTNFTVTDLTTPTVIAENVTPGVDGTNSPYNISVNVTDNIASAERVDTVLANVTYVNGSTNLLTMTNGTNTTFNVSLTLDTTAPVGVYNITFIANDTSNNINNTIRTNFTINSTSGLADAPDDTDTSGYIIEGDVNATINITKDYPVDQFVNFTDDTLGLRLRLKALFSQGPVNFSKLIIEADGTNTAINTTGITGVDPVHFVVLPNTLAEGLFVCPQAQTLEEVTTDCANITIFTYQEAVQGTIKNGYNVSLLGNFLIGNMTGSGAGEGDLTLPNVTANVTPISGAQANAFTILANVTDDNNVSTVLANITYPNGSSFTLTLVNHTNVEFNNTYTPALTDATGRYNVTILANDSSDNVNNTVTTNFTVTDASLPGLTNLSPSGVAFNQRQDINITANVTDNTNVSVVRANITQPAGDSVIVTLIQSSTDIFNATYADADQLGNYTLQYLANDTSDNVNDSSIIYFRVNDSHAPNVTSVASAPTTGDQGATFNISAVVIDNANISQVFMNITGPGTGVYLQMRNVSSTYNELFNTTTSTAAGIWTATIYANDTSGLINRTASATFTVTEPSTTTPTTGGAGGSSGGGGGRSIVPQPEPVAPTFPAAVLPELPIPSLPEPTGGAVSPPELPNVTVPAGPGKPTEEPTMTPVPEQDKIPAAFLLVLLLIICALLAGIYYKKRTRQPITKQKVTQDARGIRLQRMLSYLAKKAASETASAAHALTLRLRRTRPVSGIISIAKLISFWRKPTPGQVKARLATLEHEAKSIHKENLGSLSDKIKHLEESALSTIKSTAGTLKERAPTLKKHVTQLEREEEKSIKHEAKDLRQDLAQAEREEEHVKTKISQASKTEDLREKAKHLISLEFSLRPLKARVERIKERIHDIHIHKDSVLAQRFEIMEMSIQHLEHRFKDRAEAAVEAGATEGIELSEAGVDAIKHTLYWALQHATAAGRVGIQTAGKGIGKVERAGKAGVTLSATAASAAAKTTAMALHKGLTSIEHAAVGGAALSAAAAKTTARVLGKGTSTLEHAAIGGVALSAGAAATLVNALAHYARALEQRSVNRATQEIKSLTNEIREAEQELISNIKQAVKEIATELTTFERRTIKTAKDEVKEVKEGARDLEHQEVSTIKQESHELARELSSIERGSIAQVQAKLHHIKDDLHQKERSAVTLAGHVIHDIMHKITLAEASHVNAIETRIDRVRTKISLMRARHDEFDTRIKSLDFSIARFKEEEKELGQYITKVRRRVNKLPDITSHSLLDEEIAQIKATLATIKAHPARTNVHNLSITQVDKRLREIIQELTLPRGNTSRKTPPHQ